jgi:hypothetical protein
MLAVSVVANYLAIADNFSHKTLPNFWSTISFSARLTIDNQYLHGRLPDSFNQHCHIYRFFS